MNLLFASCIPTWGGGENWMLSAMLGLRERGHRIHLAGRSGSELVLRARAENMVCTEIDYRGDFDPRTFWRFFRLCRSGQIDVLCLNMQRVLRIAGPAARLAGVKAVIPRVGSQAPLGGKPSHVWAWKYVANGIIANSRATGQTLLESASWLPPDRVRIRSEDTDISPLDLGAYSSRTTLMGGNAVKMAAEDVLARLFPVASTLLGCPAEDLRADDGIISCLCIDTIISIREFKSICLLGDHQLITDHLVTEALTRGKGDVF